jgi:hypothetical protein
VVSNYNKVTLKETRRFAGKDIEVSHAVTVTLLCLVQISSAHLSHKVACHSVRQGTHSSLC